MTDNRPNPRRQFIRHTADVPLEVRTLRAEPARRETGVNVSVGGLAFTSDRYLAPGQIVELRIAAVQPPFEARACVAWCRQAGARYQVGARFLDPGDAFRARMVEQVCTIERYRREVLAREGRALSGSEAAAEWIARYAARFPDSG